MKIAPPNDPADRLYLDRACELAARGIGSTAPNPPVGAVVVSDGRIVGEGYHHRCGTPHAEANALAQAGEAARGATLYVSLEPCAVEGRVPACAPAIAAAGIARVVAGTTDPNPKNGGLGVTFLRERGIAVDVRDDACSRELIELFAGTMAAGRPYVALKMAMSLDGAISARPHVQQWITSEGERLYVRELRIAYDAVMVGAGTVRVDDPQLTVRPPYHRLRPFVRIVVCERGDVAPDCRVFAAEEDYSRTIVLAPGAARARLAVLGETAELLLVGGDDAQTLDLAEAMRVLGGRGIASVLCEGGPTLGARMIAAGVVDRFYWAIAPKLLGNVNAAPVLSGVDFAALDPHLRFDRIVHAGDDIVLSGTFPRV